MSWIVYKWSLKSQHLQIIGQNLLHYWKWNIPVPRSGSGRLVGWSVCHYFPKGISLPYSYRSTSLRGILHIKSEGTVFCVIVTTFHFCLVPNLDGGLPWPYERQHLLDAKHRVVHAELEGAHEKLDCFLDEGGKFEMRESRKRNSDRWTKWLKIINFGNIWVGNEWRTTVNHYWLCECARACVCSTLYGMKYTLKTKWWWSFELPIIQLGAPSIVL